MRFSVAIVVALVGTSARGQEWKAPDAPEIAALAITETLIVVDVLQTYDAFNRHRGEYVSEVNPLLGTHPSNARIIGFGVAGGLLTAGAWLALPPRMRLLVPAVVIPLELFAVIGNANAGFSVRF